MNNKIKKYYKYLGLAYNSTIEDVELRKKALIKVLHSKANENKISTEKEIAIVEQYTNKIIENIKVNGVLEGHCFETSKESILGLVIVLIFVVAICVFSFYSFL